MNQYKINIGPNYVTIYPSGNNQSEVGAEQTMPNPVANFTLFYEF